MKKTLISIAAALVLILVVVAFCSQKEKDGPGGDTEDSTSSTVSDSVSGVDTAESTAETTDVQTLPPETPDIVWTPKGMADTYRYDGEVLILNAVNCPVIEELEGYSIGKINSALQDFCEKYVGINSTRKKEVRSDYNAAVSDGRDFESYEKSADFSLYVRGNVLSVLFSSYESSGGANSERIYYPFNFDLISGEKLTLAGYLGKDEIDTKEYLSGIFTELINSNPQNFFENALEMLNDAISLDNYYLSSDGLVLYLDAYSLSPSALGIQTVTVKYNKLP